MSAHKVLRWSKGQDRTPKNRKLFKYLIVFLLFFVIFLFAKFLLRTKYWSGDNRVVVVIQPNTDGNVLVSSIDPVVKEIVNIVIPQNTEIEVAGNLGKWKIGKVSDLGHKEDRNGELLASSITSYFAFPVVAWGSSEALGMVNGGIDGLIGLLLDYDTNLSFGDRIAITFFSLSLDNVQRTNIDLKNTPLLKQVALEDGSEGYKLTTLSAPKIYSYFTDYHISQSPTRVIIFNGTDNTKLASMVAKVVQVMGGGVASISKLDETVESDFVCKVGPAGDAKTTLISAVFGCEFLGEGIADNYDLEIVLGNKFNRFY